MTAIACSSPQAFPCDLNNVLGRVNGTVLVDEALWNINLANVLNGVENASDNLIRFNTLPRKQPFSQLDPTNTPTELNVPLIAGLAIAVLLAIGLLK